MNTSLFPHAETLALLAEHLAARSVRAARCYSLAKEASQNGLHQHAATLVDEARGHTAKADSYRASMRQLCVMPAPGPEVLVPNAQVVVSPAPFRNIRGPEDHA